MSVIDKLIEKEVPSLEICPQFHTLSGTRTSLYREIVRSSLEDVVPFLFEPEYGRLSPASQQNIFEENLPLVNKRIDPRQPLDVALFLVCESKRSIFHFFFTIVSSWLNPGKRLDVGMLNATDFTISNWSDTVYNICEIVLTFNSINERDQVLSQFPHLVNDIKLGATSSFYAQKILESKALSADAKGALIHEKTLRLMERFPNKFGKGFFDTMQRTLVLLDDEFKEKRSAKLISRLVASVHHLNDNEVHVFRTEMGVSVVAKPKELIEKRQVLDAICHILGNVEIVPNSFNAIKNVVYIELKQPISAEEIHLLKREFPKALSAQGEGMIYPVFMPRNEEEIMRNTLQLAQEIRYVRDIPHLTLLFEEQTSHELIYNVILARVTTDQSKNITELLTPVGKQIYFILDTVKEIGPMRKNYYKEAYLLRAHLNKEPFLRKDYTIDLYKARDALLNKIISALGPIRDYNGGMISREKQTFKLIKKEIEKAGPCNELLLENMFYTIDPPVMRTLVNSTLFAKLYHQMEEHLNSRHKGLEIRFEEEGVIAITKVDDPAFKKKIQKGMRLNGALKSEFGLTLIKRAGRHYLGTILLSQNDELKEALLHLLK